jgi:LysR family transcriptional regulator, transcriptional activator of the cysJI operon
LGKTVSLGASYTIGSHILPGEPIIGLNRIFQSKIRLVIDSCDKIIEWVKSGDVEIGLIETPLYDESLIYDKWMEDELVVCSKIPLGEVVGADVLSRCRLLCRNEHSPTRMFINDHFESHGLSYGTFYSLTEVSNTTSVIQGIKWSRPSSPHPTVAILSLLAITDELERHELFSARVGSEPIYRDFYLVYQKSETMDIYRDEIIKVLSSWDR